MSKMTESNNSTALGNHTLGGNSTNDVSLDKLYPAIVQCFTIILLGYVAGRTNILSSSQGRGIGTFVSTFCLPALLFKSMCSLNFQAVDWMFLLSILVSKTLLFVAVVIITLLAKRPVNYGLAGIYGVFVTQSNDFALGYPILQALYKTSHPEYLDYIYLIAPISVMFLNPIGFAMLEIQKRRSSQTNSTSCKMFLHVIKDVVTNPLVFMTFIGIIGNFIFQHTIPAVLSDILDVLGEAFNATALFYLGLSLVGKVKGKSGLHLVTPLLLIGAKTLILPIITWQFVGSLDTNSSNNDTMSVSMYGFLYGTFPTAPSVFLYASHFNIAMDTIATGLVAGTLLSAPIMFVSARMMTMGVNDQIDYKSLLLDTSISTSIISLVCCVWVLFALVLSRNHKRLPQQFLILFIFSHMLTCSAMVTISPEDASDSVKHYITDSLIIIGLLSTRFFAAVMSVSLYLIHTYSLCFLLRIKWWLVSLSLGLPILGTCCISLLTSCRGAKFEVDPSFVYGTCQSLTFLLSLLVCSIVNIACLVLRQRYHRDSKSYSKLEEDESIQNSFIVYDTPASTEKNILAITPPIHSKRDDNFNVNYRPLQRSNDSLVDNQGPFPGDVSSIMITPENNYENDRETIESSMSVQDRGTNRRITCRSRLCSDKHRHKCENRLSIYFKRSCEKIFDEDRSDNMAEMYINTDSRFQSEKFIILLVTLQISMGIGMFLYIWRLFNSQLSGIYVAIEFLDCVFNYGQGFLVCALFGFETKLIFIPFVKKFRKFIYGAEVVRLPNEEDLEEETHQLCHQFIKYHMEGCKNSIVKDRKYRFREYKQVFTGTQFCDWLIEIGLVKDRGDAVSYGRSLLIGRIIEHVTSEHHFHDSPYFYRFSTTSSIINDS